VFRNKIAALPMDAHWWRRIFLGNASDVDVDGSGRVLIAPELRAAAMLDKEVMLLGMGSHFEVWDAQTYAAKEQAAMAQGMPDALKNFTF
jgi:MraZ protein